MILLKGSYPCLLPSRHLVMDSIYICLTYSP